MLKRLVVLVSLSLATMLLTVLAIGIHPAFAKSFTLGAKNPFVAEQITKMFDTTGVLRHTVVSTFGQKADGSWVESRVSSDGQPTGGKRIILDVSIGTRTSIVSSIQAKTTYQLTSEEIARTVEPDASCGNSIQDMGELKVRPERTERTTFLGFSVIKVAWEGTYPNGTVRTLERWLAPNLNCFALKEIATWKHPGQSSGPMTVTEVLSVKQVAPDSALFEIDSSLVEKQPSQVIQDEAQLQGRNCQACQFAHGQLDQAYMSHHSAR